MLALRCTFSSRVGTRLSGFPILLQASERRLRPMPQQQRTLHEKILEEIKQERKLRPVELQHQDQRGVSVLKKKEGGWFRCPILQPYSFDPL